MPKGVYDRQKKKDPIGIATDMSNVPNVTPGNVPPSSEILSASNPYLPSSVNSDMFTLDIPDGAPWRQLPGEPDLWYHRFVTYYLAQPASSRTIRTAFNTFQRVECNNPEGKRGGDQHWRSVATRYKWSDRTAAYDNYMRRQFMRQIEEQRSAIYSELLNSNLVVFRQIVGEIARRGDEELSRESMNSLQNTLKTTFRNIVAIIGSPSEQKDPVLQVVHSLPPELQQVLLDVIKRKGSGVTVDKDEDTE